MKEEESVPVVEKSRELVTPEATPRRISMKASVRKTPKSMLKSALDVVRSRRSGASRANLKGKVKLCCGTFVVFFVACEYFTKLFFFVPFSSCQFLG